MYAYTARKAGQQEEYWEQDADVDTVTKPREIAYWRKHPNLHGWMERLWENRLADQGINPDESQFGSAFNGVELELTWDDLDRLEQDVVQGRLPATQGFFFGENADSHYKKTDLEFIKNARAELFLGLKVFYNSSW